jgi:preprotein translocase subunit YajC
MFLLAFAPATSPDGTRPDPTGQTVQMVGMMVIMVIMFYFVLIRPQQKKAKEHEKLLTTVKKDDKIVTSSGIVGTVISVRDRFVSIRSADSKLEVLKSSISEIAERGAAGPAASSGDK